MDIRNTTQFANFIGANDFTKLDNALLEIVLCINNFSAACDCHNRNDKMIIYNTCQGIYYNAVRNVLPKHQGAILSKTGTNHIAFYTDGGALIGIISR